MLTVSVYLWLLPILIVVHKSSLSNAKLTQKWMEQPQNHFDERNNNTWWMRYYENDEYFHGTGPIFIVIGGEWEITSDYLEASFIVEMARIHGAMMYNTEHRYYGQSYPVPDTSLDNLAYLSIQQALADIAFFTKKKRNELEIPNAPVIVFGCSYAGNLAAWMRVAYPELIHGAVASSAPIYSKADFFEFLEFIADSLHKHDENCVINIKKAFSTVEKLITGPASNSIKLKYDFNLCNKPDFSQFSDVSFMISHFAGIFSKAVFYNKLELNGKTSIENVCTWMTKSGADTSPYSNLVETFNRFHSGGNYCIDLKYDHFLASHVDISWKSEVVKYRMWIYQACAELGNQQTSSSPKSIFGSLFSLQYFVKLCKDLFSKSYELYILNNNIKQINSRYNSKLSHIRNIVFINGDLDPWHLLSPLSDLNYDSPSILINVKKVEGAHTLRGWRQPLYPIELWNVHLAVKNKEPRTNNAVEGRHNAFNRRVAIAHTTIGKFIVTLQEEQHTTALILEQHLAGGRLAPRKRKTYCDLDQRLENVTADYGNGADNVLEYLRAIAYNISL